MVNFGVGMKWENLDAEMLMGFEEIEVDDDIREEFPCCFCSEYFDIVGLCCHIDDEHPVEAKNGVYLSFCSVIVELITLCCFPIVEILDIVSFYA